ILKVDRLHFLCRLLFFTDHCHKGVNGFLGIGAFGRNGDFRVRTDGEAHNAHNAFGIHFFLAFVHEDFGRVFVGFLYEQRCRARMQSRLQFDDDILFSCFRHFSNLLREYRTIDVIITRLYALLLAFLNLSAIWFNFRNLWLTPDLLTFWPDSRSPSSFKLMSGWRSLNSATCRNRGDNWSSPISRSMRRIFSTCRIAALIVLFKLAVSQLTIRLTELRMSFTIRTSSKCKRAWWAPMRLRNCVIFSPSLT